MWLVSVPSIPPSVAYRPDFLGKEPVEADRASGAGTGAGEEQVTLVSQVQLPPVCLESRGLQAAEFPVKGSMPLQKNSLAKNASPLL